MKKLLIGLALIGTIASNVQANSLTSLGLGSLSGSSSAVEYSIKDIQKVFTSNQAACFKDGSKVIGFNNAYKAQFKTRKACTKKNGKRLGVIVITTGQLTSDAYKTLAKTGLIKL